MKEKAKNYLINFGVMVGVSVACHGTVAMVKEVKKFIVNKVAPFFKKTPEDQYSNIFEE